MSTNALICRQIEDGTFEDIYLHWDGDSSKPILDASYVTKEDVNALFEHGNMSSLDYTLEGSVFYMRDRGEDPECSLPNTAEDLDRFARDVELCEHIEYVYLLQNGDTEWSKYTHEEFTEKF